MQTKRFKIVPASYLILMKEGKVLLSRRCNTGFEDGNYTLPSGHLEGNETFRQCMAREAMEEAGIDILENDLEVAHVMNRQELSNPLEIRERVDLFLKSEKWQGEIKNMEPEKCDDLSWFDLENLPENAIPYIKQALICVREGIFYSEFGW